MRIRGLRIHSYAGLWAAESGSAAGSCEVISSQPADCMNSRLLSRLITASGGIPVRSIRPRARDVRSLVCFGYGRAAAAFRMLRAPSHIWADESSSAEGVPHWPVPNCRNRLAKCLPEPAGPVLASPNGAKSHQIVCGEDGTDFRLLPE